MDLTCYTTVFLPLGSCTGSLAAMAAVLPVGNCPAEVGCCHAAVACITLTRSCLAMCCDRSGGAAAASRRIYLARGSGCAGLGHHLLCEDIVLPGSQDAPYWGDLGSAPRMLSCVEELRALSCSDRRVCWMLVDSCLVSPPPPPPSSWGADVYFPPVPHTRSLALE